MLTIIDPTNRKQNADLLDALFWERYETFVIGRGWQDLYRPDGRDIDQFDDADTVYVVIHEGGEVVAGCRIRPSEKPHLLLTAFSHLVPGGRPPVGPHIFECSRLFVQRRHPDRIQLFLQLLSATVDWYRAHGISVLTGVIESWWINSFLSLGFRIIPLGRPEKSDRNAIVAVQVTIDADLQKNLHTRLHAAQAEEPSPDASVATSPVSGARIHEKAA